MSTQALLSRTLGSPLAAAALLVLGLCFESRVPLFFGGGEGGEAEHPWWAALCVVPCFS